MLQRIIEQLRSQWIGSVALFMVVAGGVAYAASVPMNSVGSPEIKNGSVKGIDVKDNSLRGSEIAEDSLVLPEGPPGPPGEPGPPVPPGDAGPSAFGSFHNAKVPLPTGFGIGGLPRAGEEDVLTLDLPAGKYLIEAKGTLQDYFLPTTHTTCFLYANGSRDFIDIYSIGPFFLSELGGPPDPFTVHLACNDRVPSYQTLNSPPVSDLKINAIAVKDFSYSSG